MDLDGAFASLTGSGPAGESAGVQARIPTGAPPAATRDGRRAVWAERSLGTDNEYHHVLVGYDVAARRRLSTIPLEHGADAVQLSGDGTLVVATKSAGCGLEVWRLPQRWDPLVPLLRSAPPAGPSQFQDSTASELP